MGAPGEREAKRSLPQPRRQRRPTIRRKLLRIRRIRELQFMVPEFVDRMRGSKWPSALPTGSAAPQSAGKPADSKNPAALMYGGWVRVLFGGSKWVRALPARGSNRLSALPTRD